MNETQKKQRHKVESKYFRDCETEEEEENEISSFYSQVFFSVSNKQRKNCETLK